MDPNNIEPMAPRDLDAIAAELQFWSDYDSLNPQEQDALNWLMDQILNSPTMDAFDANWQVIEYYNPDTGTLDDIEFVNDTSQEVIEASTEMWINNGYYDYAGGGDAYGDYWDYIFSDWSQGVGGTSCPATDWDWFFYF